MKKADTTKMLSEMFCNNHTGKMNGLQSLSSACTENQYCKARAKNKDLVCSHCFSMTMQKRYKTLTAKLQRNSEILQNEIFPVDVWPRVNAAIFRLEAFGDLANETQCINYFNLCKRNPETSFSLWTKNPFIIDRVLKAGETKPKNLIVIFSSPCLNKASEKVFERFSFVDKIFTVYDKDHAGSVNVNCGARSCNDCRRCYSKRTGKVVNELLK